MATGPRRSRLAGALGRRFLGSVSKKLATESLTSVRVARGAAGKGGDVPPRVMTGVDGSPGAERAVRSAGGRVWPRGTEARIVAVDGGISPLRIAHILPSAAAAIKGSNEEALAEARRMAEWAAEELQAIGLRVTIATVKGEPRSVQIDEALGWAADSVFVGSRGPNYFGEESGLGNVSAGLATNAPCSVEIVRSNLPAGADGEDRGELRA